MLFTYRIQKVFTSLFAFLALLGCNSKSVEKTYPKITPEGERGSYLFQGITYEIFVQSFADSNGDGIGDIPGMTSKLDYLEQLGVEAVWLMPINPSESYHKYDVMDYKEIHPDYGTMEDFKLFVNEAHKRGIQVMIDLVVNHTSAKHPWFLEAIKGPENPYRDYYVWGDIEEIADQIEKKETHLDSDNITQWHAVKGNKEEPHYYGFFWGGMPDLNFDNPNVREEIFAIGKYWLKEVNVDGFRLDAAKHIYPDDRPEDNHQWWIEFREKMEEVNPNVHLVGEVWADAETVAPYLAGLNSTFNFDLGRKIIEVVNSGNHQDLVKTHKQIQDFYKNVTPDFIDATFLTNHDQNRIFSEVEDNVTKAKLAASILMTLPGAPYIYYGEELGMRGKKPDEEIREPFLWDTKALENTAWRTAKYNTLSTLKPLATQKNDALSVYHHYKRVIQLRRSSDVLSLGVLTNCKLEDTSVLSFIRERNGTKMLVLHNLNGKKVTLTRNREIEPFNEVYFTSDEGLKMNTKQLVLPAFSTVVFTQEN